MSIPTDKHSPIRTIVVDDDPLERRMLLTLIAEHSSLICVGEADSPLSASKMIAQEKPDVLFLDIHMPEKTGFDLLRGLEIVPKVIFVTSSTQHALDAFELDAVDYLLKPVKPERFAASIRRLERIFHTSSAPLERHEKTDRICLRSQTKTEVVPLTQIVSLHADGNFTRFHCANGASLLVCQSLGSYEEILPMPPFARLDRSLMVNIDRITQAERLSRNQSKLWLRGLPAPLDLGRTATERLKEVLDDHQARN